MKNGFLKNSSQRVLFSAMMVSALVAGNVAPMHAEVTSVQSVLQSVSVKGQVLDAEGIPVIGASVLEKGTTNGIITKQTKPKPAPNNSILCIKFCLVFPLTQVI